MPQFDEVTSTFQKRPAYRYIRRADKLPQYEDLPQDDAIVCRVKLFNPSGAGTWWIASYDPDTGVAFGVADLGEREAGDFSVLELAELRVCPFGLPIERDLYYSPGRLVDLLAAGRRVAI
jgi:hypothetical protein